MQAVGKVIEGSSYLQQGKYNQAIADRNALAAESDAAAQVDVSREQLRKTMGEQLVQQGASAMEMGTGSAVDQLMDSQVNGMLDAMAIRRQGRTQGEAYRQQGVLAKMQAKTQATASYFGAAKALTDQMTSYAGGAG
ncbi:hypothetical protein [Sphingomonas parapaucimobilis]|uniref:Uncharacterized protein n=1 Tax=Sphingomonas parapaucimobilis NBRC 15100 TaxID=1219049 RepID=A0A0A1W726_9SPHN|nr:hypothetical protein [Sphingomonas parapaucimobilis]GAM00709.1 hypothetical protein SP5_035_01090 [Sphingomonas parapaucimobilis NBRC 15100]